MKTNKTYYGVFYKSNGRWTGPYGGFLSTKSQLKGDVCYLKTVLKSKIAVRKVKFV